jgi:methylation protein EvaC
MPIAKSGAAGAPASTDPQARLAASLMAATCPACGHHVAAPFYGGRRQPLATLGWPRTSEQARSMEALPLDFVRCTDCGHVFNASFDYRRVPYSEMPNLMFNRGALWSRFLAEIGADLARRLPRRPTVVEIGYGDASFLEALANRFAGGRAIGFDPHGAPGPQGSRLELRRELFEPGRHLALLLPDLIVSRHVMEHLTDPLGFIQHLGLAAASLGLSPLMYLEVPCIDRALETGRTADFYYEHNSHFTTASFHRMLARSGALLESLGHGYDGEVVYALARLTARAEFVRNGLSALAFSDRAAVAGPSLEAALEALYESGARLAIWGGTGKSAAFINAHGMDARRFPVVVDSDPAKAGTFVPGAGQIIRFRDWLLAHPVDAILIPCQWRAADIAREIAGHGIACERILIEHLGKLVDFRAGQHPYGRRDADLVTGSAPGGPAIGNESSIVTV